MLISRLKDFRFHNHVSVFETSLVNTDSLSYLGRFIYTYLNIHPGRVLTKIAQTKYLNIEMIESAPNEDLQDNLNFTTLA